MMFDAVQASFSFSHLQILRTPDQAGLAFLPTPPLNTGLTKIVPWRLSAP